MYNVKLKPSFTGLSRRRAGLEVLKGHTLTVELDKEQLALLKADEMFIVEKAPKASKASNKEEVVETPEVEEVVEEVVETPEVESE
jgi:hypothetical protein